MKREGGRFALPLLLVAAMVAIGSGIEIVVYGEWDWAPKLPLIALLGLALLRTGAGGGRRP